MNPIVRANQEKKPEETINTCNRNHFFRGLANLFHNNQRLCLNFSKSIDD